MRRILFPLFFVAGTAWAGRDCGAQGDWRSKFIPDTWGKAKLYRACQKHDTCYSSLGVGRAECDHAFKADMFAECKRAYGWGDAVSGCRPAAVTYYEFVVAYGSPYYDAAQQQARAGQGYAEENETATSSLEDADFYEDDSLSYQDFSDESNSLEGGGLP